MNFTRLVLFACAALGLATSPVKAGSISFTSGGASPSIHATAESAPPQPALFRVKSETATVYLFGSMHIMEPSLKWRTRAFDDALAKADIIWLESTTQDMANPALLWDNYKSAYNDDRKLNQILTPQEWTRVNKVAKDLGVSLMEYNDLHAWVVADLLLAARNLKDKDKTKTAPEKKLGEETEDDNPGIEAIIEGMAMGKPIRPLENTRNHVMLFSTLTPEDEKALLMQTVEDIEQSRSEDIEAIKSAWLTGDLDAMNALGNIPMQRTTPGLYNVMIVKRNREMADGIVTQLKGKQTHFVAVGAMHLSGPDSVIALLEKSGYRVERLYAPDAPIASTTHRRLSMPGYRVGAGVPPYLNVSLRRDPAQGSGKVFIHLVYPLVVNGCIEVSPVEYRMQNEKQTITIRTAGYLLNIHPLNGNGGCGTPNKLIGVNIPIDIASLKMARTRPVTFAFTGAQDRYTLTYHDNGAITLTPPPATRYYHPDVKNLSVSNF